MGKAREPELIGLGERSQAVPKVTSMEELSRRNVARIEAGPPMKCRAPRAALM